MKRLSLFLQLVGLVLLPVGLFYGLGQDDVRLELTLLGVGGFLFALGKLVLEPRA